jgi:hypothetical protein
MGWFQGWKKIYLFYGVIFFCLGGAGGYLRAPAAWDGFGRGLQRLVADLRYYTTADSEETSPAVTVVAPSPVASVVFFYPENWTKQFPTVICQAREVLAQNFARMEMRAVKGKLDWSVGFAAGAGKYSSQVVAAVEADHTGTRERLVYLRWWTLTTPPLTGLARHLNCLPQAAQINVKLQKGNGFWGEVSWRETGPTIAGFPAVVAAWAETMSTADGAVSGRRPL